jgi:hypothetical protein
VDLAPLTSLAACQHGCFANRQLPSIGLSLDQLHRLGKQGLIVPAHFRGIHRMASSPETWHQRVMAATLSIPGSLASHRTAAALRELEDFLPGRIELLVEHGSWRRRGVTVHQTKDLVAGDRDVVLGIPCTSLVRTLVDLPAVTWEGRCGRALDRARRHDRSLFERVHARHLEVARRGRNGTVALRALLLRRGIGDLLGDTGFEQKALDLIARGGLPDPVPQFQVRDGEFVAYIDIAWPEQMVAMECDSLAYHFGEVSHQGDRSRRRQLTLLGWDVYEYTYRDVTKDQATVLRELREALGLPSATGSPPNAR